MAQDSPSTHYLTEVHDGYNYDDVAMSTVSPQAANWDNVNIGQADIAIQNLVDWGNHMDQLKRALMYPNAARYGSEGQLHRYMDICESLIDDAQQRPFLTDLIHAALGHVTESIEYLQTVWGMVLAGEWSQKQIVNLLEEAGDRMWYNPVEIRALSGLLGREITRHDIGVLNNIKLAKRMRQKGTTEPAAFDAVGVLNRDIEKELNHFDEFIKG